MDIINIAGILTAPFIISVIIFFYIKNNNSFDETIRKILYSILIPCIFTAIVESLSEWVRFLADNFDAGRTQLFILKILFNFNIFIIFSALSLLTIFIINRKTSRFKTYIIIFAVLETASASALVIFRDEDIFSLLSQRGIESVIGVYAIVFVPVLIAIFEFVINFDKVKPDIIKTFFCFVLFAVASIGCMVHFPESHLFVPVSVCAIIYFVLFVLHKYMLTDELTGLASKRSLDDFIILMSKPSRDFVNTFIVIDLDDFKAINEKYGHKHGDRALCDMANLLRRTFRKSDFIARSSNDEFVVIYKDNSKTRSPVDRLRANINSFNNRRIRQYTLDCSIGIDFYEPESDISPWEFYSEVNKLMYKERDERRKTGLKYNKKDEMKLKI